jgi:P27 family predicted phage terminase small subunit
MTRRIVPRELKILKGTYRKDRDKNSPPPSKDTPVPPSWLNKRGKTIFRLITRRLTELNLASRSFTEMIGLLASRLEEIERYSALLDAEGASFGGASRDGTEYFKPRPEAQLRERAMIHAQKLLVEFGLSPTAIMRVVAAKEEKPKKNPFER